MVMSTEFRKTQQDIRGDEVAIPVLSAKETVESMNASFRDAVAFKGLSLSKNGTGILSDPINIIADHDTGFINIDVLEIERGTTGTTVKGNAKNATKEKVSAKTSHSDKIKEVVLESYRLPLLSTCSFESVNESIVAAVDELGITYLVKIR
jgi:hypothetical protein